MVQFVEKSIFFMGEVIYLCLVVPCKVQNSGFLLVVLERQVLNHFLFSRNNFIEFLGLSGKSLRKFINFLIFQQIFIIPLRLYFLQFSPMSSLQTFLLLFLSMTLLIKGIFPVNFSHQKLFFQIVIFLLTSFIISISHLFSLRQLLLQVLMLYFNFIQYIFTITLVVICINQLFLQILHLTLKLRDSFFINFLFRLEKFCFLFFISDIPLNLIIELFLDVSKSGLVFGLHFRDNFLVHVYDLIERFRNAVSFLFQIGNLVTQNLILSFIFPSFAGFFLYSLEIGCLSVYNIISQFARSKSQCTVSSLPIFLR